MDDDATMVRNSSNSSHVGIANIPNQVYRMCMKKGVNLNVLLAGQGYTGKKAFLGALLGVPVVSSAKSSSKDAEPSPFFGRIGKDIIENATREPSPEATMEHFSCCTCRHTRYMPSVGWHKCTQAHIGIIVYMHLPVLHAHMLIYLL